MPACNTHFLQTVIAPVTPVTYNGINFALQLGLEKTARTSNQKQAPISNLQLFRKQDYL